MRPPDTKAPLLRLPRADLTVTFVVAGVRTRLEHFPVAESPFLESYYPGFYRLGTDEEVELTLDCELDLGAPVMALPELVAEPAQVVVDVSPDRLLTRSHFHEAELARPGDRGHVRFTTLHERHFRMSLENTLRVMFANLLLDRRSCLIHAAALVEDDHAHVLFGLSGSGKSRIVELLPDKPTLSDDLIVLSLDEQDRLWAERVPFYGLYPPTERHGGRYRVATLSRLERGPRHRRVALPRPLQVGRLLPCLPFLDPRDPRPLQLVTDIATALPPDCLQFADDPGFWSLLT